MISLIHPSRSRPEQAYNAAVYWLNMADDQHDIEYQISLDWSDPLLGEYQSLFPDDIMIVSHNQSAIQAANVGGKHAQGDIIVLMSDDFRCLKGWDSLILSALQNKSGLLKTFDGTQRWICTLPIYTMDYYQEQGYIYPPQYSHLFPDTHITHVADLKKKLIIRNDIVFNHDHHSKHAGPKDEVTKKADSTWAQGEGEYLKACKAKFGLGNVDIFNLSKEAKEAGHVQWLKKKLR